MDFNIKLQKLRKQKNLTQDELASALFVSRTAISKWESGRGYPSIDSLKEIAKFFDVTIDELLSGDEILSIAENDSIQKKNRFIDLIFALLDISVAVLLFTPLFAQRTHGKVNAVSLLNLSEISPFLIFLYYFFIIAIIITGILILIFQNSQNKFWTTLKIKLSLVLNIIATIFFIIGLQPYASVFLFIFIIIKSLILLKK